MFTDADRHVLLHYEWMIQQKYQNGTGQGRGPTVVFLSTTPSMHRASMTVDELAESIRKSQLVYESWSRSGSFGAGISVIDER